MLTSKMPRFLIFISLMLVIFFWIISNVIAQEKLTENSKLVMNGIGGIKVGMTIKQAEKAAGISLVIPRGFKPNKDCYYVEPKKYPKGISFMVTEYKISRVDIWENKKITTFKGAKLDDSEARIKSLYPKQIKVTPHKYNPQGHYLTFIPQDSADKNYRIVFETDGKKVVRFRSGKLPDVEFIEGCA